MGFQNFFVTTLKNISLRWKFVLGPLLILAVFLAFVIFQSTSISDRIIVSTTLEYLGAEVELRAEKASQGFLRAAQDASLFTSVSPIQGLVRARAAGGHDAEGESSHDDWQGRLESIFSSFAETRGTYSQIRLLSETGDELVRVNHTDGVTSVVQANELQNKADRYYFVEASGRQVGDLYVSGVDLNREGDGMQLKTPHEPTIRYAMPVFDDAGVPRGITAANFNVSQVIGAVADQPKGRRIFLIDQDGYFLLHPDNSKEWGSPRDLAHGARYHDTRSEIVEQVLSGKKGHAWGSQSLIVFSPVYFDPGDATRYLVLVEEMPTSVVTSVVKGFHQRLIASGILLFLGLAGVLLFFVRRLTAPLSHLQLVAQKVSAGDMSQRADFDAGDEVGTVSEAFNEMLDTIGQYQTGLEQKVQERTREIEQAKQELEKSNHTMVNLLGETQQEKERYRAQLLETQKFQGVVENATDGVVIIGPDETILYVNRAFERLVGHHGHDLQHESFWNLVGVATSDETKAHIADVFREGDTITTESLFLTRGDEGGFMAAASFFPILKDEERKFSVGLVQDITIRKEIDKAKAEFVSLASHQLRTPLSTISWYIEMLLSGDVGELNSEQKTYAQEAYEGARRMVELVNSLLNVSRIELGTLMVEPKPTDVVRLLHSVVDELKPVIREKHLVVRRDFDTTLPELNVDPKLLRMVFQNLSSNAVKYTPPGGEVAVRLVREGENILFSVKDSGIGIPKQQHKLIFGKLFRADNAKASDTEGTGLGLYVVKQIVERSGGRAWFESKEGEGSTFYVSLPCSGMMKKQGGRSLEG